MAPDIESLSALYADHIDYLGRRTGEALAERAFDALVISAGSVAPKSRFDDQDLPFQPTPAFAHWIPLRAPGSALVIRPGATPRLIRAVAGGFWEAPARVESHHAWSAFDIYEADSSDVAAELPSAKRCAFIGEDPDRARAWGFADEAINPPALLSALAAIRATKTDYERACIRAANRRAARGHARLREAFEASDQSELALHLLYLRATEQDDPDTPYKNIVAMGENAATLHHVEYGRTAAEGATGSLLVDAGARCLGYASDITRTWVKGDGEAARAFAELVDRVDALQRQLVSEIALRMAFESLHDRAHELLAEVLRDLDLVRADPAAIVEGGATRAFFPHGLGHSLGIQVHDVGLRPRDPRPDNAFLRNTSTIEAGHVFTIEPGCYFIPSLLDELRGKAIAADVQWETVNTLRPFGGVRIEDNIAVTDAGVENLTRPAFETVD